MIMSDTRAQSFWARVICAKKRKLRKKQELSEKKTAV